MYVHIILRTKQNANIFILAGVSNKGAIPGKRKLHGHNLNFCRNSPAPITTQLLPVHDISPFGC